jgi:metal-sulfur cluster biosynthetic enzyme
MAESEVKPEDSAAQSSESSDVRADVVRQQLRSVVDPELGIDIIELGLVYGVDIEGDGKVNVRMTLTSPACPLGAVIQAQVHTALTKLPWVKEPNVQLVWSPRWDPHQMATEDARMQLGIL